jgi:branched-chain amino acid transport system substrate-binding protein
LSISAVANETEVPHFTLSPVVLTDKNGIWSFNLAQPTETMASALFEHMDKARVKSIGYIGFSDVWGDQWLGELKKYAAKSGVKITAEERFGRADTSVSGQVLRLMSTNPDVVLVGGSLSASGLVHKSLVESNYKGTIYHTHGAAVAPFLRIAGAAGEGAIAPAGPCTVAEELPGTNASKGIAMAFAKTYEAKYGAGTRTPFAAHMYDGAIVLQKAVPIALQKAKPGTKAFRAALKLAVESIRELPVTEGVYNYTAADHNGTDQRSRVLVVVKGGAWRFLQE